MEIMAHYGSNDQIARKRFAYFFEKYRENTKDEVNNYITDLPLS